MASASPSPGWPSYPHRWGCTQPGAGGSELRHGGDRRFNRGRSGPPTTGGDQCQLCPVPPPLRPFPPPPTPPSARPPIPFSPHRSPLPQCVRYRTSRRSGPAAADSTWDRPRGDGCWPPAWRWPPQHWPAEPRTVPYEPRTHPSAPRQQRWEAGEPCPKIKWRPSVCHARLLRVAGQLPRANGGAPTAPVTPNPSARSTGSTALIGPTGPTGPTGPRPPARSALTLWPIAGSCRATGHLCPALT